MWIGKRDEVGANDTWRRNGGNAVTAANIIACLLRLNASNVSACVCVVSEVLRHGIEKLRMKNASSRDTATHQRHVTATNEICSLEWELLFRPVIVLSVRQRAIVISADATAKTSSQSPAADRIVPLSLTV